MRGWREPLRNPLGGRPAVRGVLRGAACLLVALTAVACGDEPGGSSEEIQRYSYVGLHPLPLTDDTMRISGVMEIREVSDTEIDGRWDAEQLRPELHGERQENVYTVYAMPTYGGTLRHQIVLVEGALSCEGRYTWVAADGNEQVVPAQCGLAPVGEAPRVPEISGPRAPAVRPLNENEGPLQ